MTKTAHTSQQKFGNRGFRKAYAFKISRVNADYVSFKVWLLGAASRIKTISVEDIPQLLEQIDTAFAENSFVVNFPDLSFSLSEKLLCSIREQLKKFGASRTDIADTTPAHFCSIRGDSAAQALGSSANAQLTKGATRAANGAKQISEAAAQAVRPKQPRTSSTRGERTLPARQISHKSGVKDSRRKSRAVRCPRGASISRCGGVKARRHDTEKSPKPSGVAASGNQIRTKHGRTSVVVATRKVS